MIKINLLPPSFRIVKKIKTTLKPASAVSKSGFLAPSPKLALIVVGGLFLILTIYFDFSYLRISKKVKLLNSQASATLPQMQSLKVLEQEVTEMLVPERDFLMTYVLNKAPITNVLQKMSEALPDGMWLQNFLMNNSGKERSFHVSGLAINIENQTNIEQIEQYLQKLKSVIPAAQFTYSTTKQIFEKMPTTEFSADYKWQADQ